MNLKLVILSTVFAVAFAGRPGPGSKSTTTTTTTTTTVEYSSLCDEVTSSTSTDSPSANSYCGDDAIGYYEVCESDGYRYIISSGAPDHPAEYDQTTPNPNSRCELWQFVKVDMTWADTGDEYEDMGVTGYCSSGGTFFDHRSNDDDDAELAIYWEGDSLDPYNGHSTAYYQYHYHAVPAGYSSANDTSACEHIGYMRDGGKIYGYCSVDGVQLTSCYHAVDSDSDATVESDYYYEATDDCQLDECNMYYYDGEWAYFLSDTHPYVPPCMKGTVSSAIGFTPSWRS